MQRRAFLLGACGLTALAACQRATPAYHAIDITGASYELDFKLMGPQQRAYTLADFKGSYLLLFFGFTQCPDVCPTALSRAVEIRQKLGADAARVKVAFITIDPERDTPALLADYMRAFDPGFIGLSGDMEQTAQVAAHYKIFYKKVPSGSSYTMDHTAITYVIDPNSQIRLAFKHQQSAEECAQDLRTLMQA